MVKLSPGGGLRPRANNLMLGGSPDGVGFGPNCSARPRLGKEQRAGCNARNVIH